MLNNFVNTISFVELQRSVDRDVEFGQNDLSWESLVDKFSEHEVRSEKDGSCFMPVKFKPRDEWVLTKTSKSKKPGYRNDNNVEAITMAVLDLDIPGAKEQAEDYFSDYEYVIYSTHSYSKEKPHKFRIVLKLEEEIKGNEWPNVFKHLVANIDADKVCGNLSRIYFWPSVDSNADKKPIYIHHSGRAISKDDIISMGKDAVLKTSIEEKEKNKKNFEKKSFKSGRRHFSGKQTNKQSNYENRPTDHSYDGYCKRHRQAIENLRFEDSRHNFALKVIAREIGIFGGKTDLSSMTQFIFKASEDFSSKPLYQGNTVDEMYDMIESAYSKYHPDITTDDGVDGYDNFYDYLTNVIQNSNARAISGEWDFPVKPVYKKSKSSYKKNEYNYQELRVRHIKPMKDFIKSGNSVDFARKIINNEWNEKSFVNPNHLSKFLFYCLTKYHEHYVKEQNVPMVKFLSEETDKLACLSDTDFPEELIEKVNKMPIYWQNACKIESHKQKKEIEPVKEFSPSF